MLWIALLALVSAKMAIAVDHAGGLLDLTTGTATDDIRGRDQELLHVMANDVEDPNSGGSSGQMEIRSSPEELMETTMHASLLNEKQHTPHGNGSCTRPASDADSAQLAGWARDATVDILGASNLWDSVAVKQLYGDIGRQILEKRGHIHVTMIITAKRVAAFGEAATWFDEENDVLKAIFLMEGNSSPSGSWTEAAKSVLEQWDLSNTCSTQAEADAATAKLTPNGVDQREICVKAGCGWQKNPDKCLPTPHPKKRTKDDEENKKIEVHTEARRKVLQDSKLPISFNYVDIHGTASGRNGLDCFAEPMPTSGPCSFPSLDETDIIHVLGGNTFYLQEMISKHSDASQNIIAIKEWAKHRSPGLLFGQSAGMIFIMDKDAAGALMKAMEEDIVETNILIGEVRLGPAPAYTPQGFSLCTNPKNSYTVKLEPLDVTWQGGHWRNTIAGDIDGYMKFMMQNKGDGTHYDQICLPPVSPSMRKDTFLNAIPQIKEYQYIASVPHMDPDLVCKVAQNMHRTGYAAGLATANKDGYIHIAGQSGHSRRDGAGIYALDMHSAYLLDVPLDNSVGNTQCVQRQLEAVYQRGDQVAACTTQTTPSHLSPARRGSVTSPLTPALIKAIRVHRQKTTSEARAPPSEASTPKKAHGSKKMKKAHEKKK